ncbi:epithelial splicing regulatory protein 1-like [Haemaphysalis longicornis]
MDRETFDSPPEPLATSSLEETPEPSGATRYQGVQYQTLPPLSTGKPCLHLRGLPDDAQPETIIEFLGQDAYSVIDQGVHIIYTPEGRPSGEAIVHMKSEEAAFWAVVNSHNRHMMGRRPSIIEALLCSVDEMKARLAGSQPGPVSFPRDGAGEPQPELHYFTNPGHPSALTPAAVATPSPLMSPASSMPSPLSQAALPETCSPDMAAATWLLVRNLPESATVQDVLAFFSGFPGLKPDGVYMLNKADRFFKDSAFVAVPCRATAVRGVLDRQCHYIGDRKIDICIVDTASALRWLRVPGRAHAYGVPPPSQPPRQ